MKLLQQLNEQADELTIVQHLINAVQQSSHFFKLRSNDDQWMYRGMDDELIPRDGFVSVLQTRKDRRPKDTPGILHDALNTMLTREFGIPYRSQGLFVSGNPGEALHYGKVAIILPEGDFKFCWSTSVSDAYAHFELNPARRFVAANSHRHGYKPEDVPERQTDFVNFLEATEWARSLFNEWFTELYHMSNYTDTDFSDAVDSDNEIMISCDEYAVVRDTELIRSYYIDAAEHILGGELHMNKDPNMKQFITAIANKLAQ